MPRDKGIGRWLTLPQSLKFRIYKGAGAHLVVRLTARRTLEMIYAVITDAAAYPRARPEKVKKGEQVGDEFP